MQNSSPETVDSLLTKQKLFLTLSVLSLGMFFLDKDFILKHLVYNRLIVAKFNIMIYKMIVYFNDLAIEGKIPVNWYMHNTYIANYLNELY